MSEQNPLPSSTLRKILHIDMDAFFASVEQRDRPELRGRPVAVGGSPSGRGVIAAASYEARVYGVRSAMPSGRAARLCPDLIFVKPRFEAYKEASQQIRAVFLEYTDLVEPLSLDEAYLDVTENHPGIASARRIAMEIKQKIVAQTGLTASAGISVNKFLAKMASGLNKPDGLTVITPEKAPAFLEALPIGRFHGIGKATEQRMILLGIETGKDLLAWDLLDLVREFGKAGHHYHAIVRGRDERRVVPERVRKSIGKERTFAQDLTDPDEMLEILDGLTDAVWNTLQRLDGTARTITLKVRYGNFETVTRSRSSESPWTMEQIPVTVRELLDETEAGERSVRLLGVSVSSLGGGIGPGGSGEGEQLRFGFGSETGGAS